MKKLRNQLYTAVFLFACCLSGIFGYGQNPVAHQGVIDLRAASLFNNYLKSSGEWAFFQHRLLPPDSLSTAKPDYIPFPVLWKDIRLHGQPLPSQGYATYSLTVLLPAKRPRIGLELHHVYSAYRLYVNGVIQSQNGVVGTTPETAKPFWVTRTIAIPPGESDTLVLVLQVANFWHARGGPFKDILIGDKDELFLKKNQDFPFGCGLYFFSSKRSKISRLYAAGDSSSERGSKI